MKLRQPWRFQRWDRKRMIVLHGPLRARFGRCKCMGCVTRRMDEKHPGWDDADAGLPERVWVIFTDDHYEPTDVIAEREDGDTLPNERAVEYVRATPGASKRVEES